MKIVVITGSGRKRGSSNYLAEEFIRGAEKAGNKVYRFDAAYKSINPCIGCNRCRESFKCIYDDAFGEIGKEMINADVIVWVTPVYFMTMTAQLKAAIDRMYQLETQKGFIGNKKYIIISTAWDSNPEVFNILVQTIDSFCHFLKWEKVGQLLVGGIDSRKQIIETSFGKDAFNLGLNQIP